MTHDERIIKVKELRVGLDIQLQILKSLSPSSEIDVSIRKVQEGIMWLGMELKRMNEVNPYPNSYDTTNTKIEPTADGLKF